MAAKFRNSERSLSRIEAGSGFWPTASSSSVPPSSFANSSHACARLTYVACPYSESMRRDERILVGVRALSRR
jgi:hypothetical protein